MEITYSDATVVAKALSDESRLRILKMLQEGELCACRILEHFNITQPTLSYHMKILTDSGLVTGRRDGAWVHYRLNRERLMLLTNMAAEFCAGLDEESAAGCCE